MIEAILGVLIGFAAGVWGYRYARRLGNKL